MKPRPQYEDGLDADGYAPANVSPAWRFVYGSEADAGDFEPVKLVDAALSAVERIRLMCNVSPDCDSPIEVQLGAAIMLFFERAGAPLLLCKEFRLDRAPYGLLLVPQFGWSHYRSDWAILTARSHGALLIECDGKDWHSNEQQKAHDARKDQSALDYGFLTLRFTGSEIYRDADGCAQKVFDAVCGGQ
jgi:very-short-patch-repair endonuclease